MLDVTVLINTQTLTRHNFNTLMNYVSFDKQQRIKQFYFEQDAYNCLLSDVLVRMEICRISNLTNNQLEFSTNKYGKPFLKNYPNIHYNISHTKNYIACVISDEPVGIDIEFIQPIELNIIKSFFTFDEVHYIMNSNDSINRFFEIWTKKESLIKFEGKGLHQSLLSFSVLDSIEDIIYYLVFNDGKAISHHCFFIHIQFEQYKK